MMRLSQGDTLNPVTQTLTDTLTQNAAIESNNRVNCALKT